MSDTAGTCPVCHSAIDGYESETEVLEEYDDGIGRPNAPGRVPAGPARRMVPGETVTTYSPCGHSAHGSPE